MHKRILIIANNNSFSTWLAKIQFVQQFFASVVYLGFDTEYTAFPSVPVTETTINGLPGTQNQPFSSPCLAYVVDPTWYQKNIIPRAAGYDAVIFVANVADLNPKVTLLPDADNGGSFNGIDQITIFVQPNSENWKAVQSGVTYPNITAFLMAHEISHWLYQLAKAPVDNTHFYFYSPNPAGVIPELLKYMPNPLSTKTATPIGPTFGPTIVKWAQAIQIQEGGKITDRNMLNNNPGNIKATSYGMSLGATKGTDMKGIPAGQKGFCIYETYEIGLSALCQLLTDACNDELIAYKPTMTLAQFTTVYALPPNGDYANGIATALGVPVTTPIEAFLKP